MAYGKNYNNNYNRNSSGNYGNSYGNGGSYARSYNGGGNSAPRKKSGSKSGMAYSRKDGEGRPWVSGWKKVSGGLLRIICGPYSKTDTYESKMGRKSQTWIAKIQPANGGQPYVQPCMYYPDTQRVVIDSMGLVLNPRANNGGYCGTYTKKGR